MTTLWKPGSPLHRHGKIIFSTLTFFLGRDRPGTGFDFLFRVFPRVRSILLPSQVEKSLNYCWFGNDLFRPRFHKIFEFRHNVFSCDMWDFWGAVFLALCLTFTIYVTVCVCVCCVWGGNQYREKNMSILSGKRFCRFSKNWQFRCMRNVVGKTKYIPKITRIWTSKYCVESKFERSKSIRDEF